MEERRPSHLIRSTWKPSVYQASSSSEDDHFGRQRSFSSEGTLSDLWSSEDESPFLLASEPEPVGTGCSGTSDDETASPPEPEPGDAGTGCSMSDEEEGAMRYRPEEKAVRVQNSVKDIIVDGMKSREVSPIRSGSESDRNLRIPMEASASFAPSQIKRAEYRVQSGSENEAVASRNSMNLVIRRKSLVQTESETEKVSIRSPKRLVSKNTRGSCTESPIHTDSETEPDRTGNSDRCISKQTRGSRAESPVQTGSETEPIRMRSPKRLVTKNARGSLTESPVHTESETEAVSIRSPKRLVTKQTRGSRADSPVQTGSEMEAVRIRSPKRLVTKNARGSCTESPVQTGSEMEADDIRNSTRHVSRSVMRSRARSPVQTGSEPEVMRTEISKRRVSKQAKRSQIASPEPRTRSPRKGRFRVAVNKIRWTSTSLLKIITSVNNKIERAEKFLQGLTQQEIIDEINKKDSRGNTIAHHACMNTLVPWLELVLEHNGDVESKGGRGRRPLHFVVSDRAINESHAREKVKLIKLLEWKGVSFNEKDRQGKTPLQLACSHDNSTAQNLVIKTLLTHKDIKLDEPLSVGGVHSTLLNISCHSGHIETALLLLKHGANPLAEDGIKSTPLLILMRRKDAKVAVRFMKMCCEKGYDMKKLLTLNNVYGRTALNEAFKLGHWNLVKYCMTFLAPKDETDGPQDHSFLVQYTARHQTNVLNAAIKSRNRGLVAKIAEICPKLLEMTNAKGMTQLHYACNMNQALVVEDLCSMLQGQNKELPLTMDDNEVDGVPCLLKFAALKGSSECLVVLLKYVKNQSTIFELLSWVSAEKNLADVLQVLLSRFDEICLGNMEGEEIKEITLLCATRGQTESLLQFALWRGATFSFEDDQGNNVIHLIAMGGHLDTAKAMLKKTNVQYKTRNKHGQTPLHLAIKNDHRDMTKLLLKTHKSMAGEADIHKVTPLMYACQRGVPFIVDLLLQEGLDKIKFFVCDSDGLNCLDHAINNSRERVAVKLLSQKDWRCLMAHSTVEGGTKTTPMRKLIESMPDVGKFVLDKCIARLEDTDNRDCTRIKLDYELLEDWFSKWMKDEVHWRQELSLDTMTTRGYDMLLQSFTHDADNDDSSDESENFKDDGTLKDGVKINVPDPVYRSEYHPLRLMMKTDESRELLHHPVVRLMLAHKGKATRLSYWVNFFLNLVLLVLVTGHSLFLPPPFYIQTSSNDSYYTWLADGEARWQDNRSPVSLFLFGKIGVWIIIALTVIYFILSLYRIWMFRHSNFGSIKGTFGMLREIAIPICTILFVAPGFTNHEYHGVNLKANWQWQLGAFAVFLVWMNFILSLQTTPFIGIYVLMFLEVFYTLLNFIFVALIFMCSFAVVFSILLLNQVPFHSVWESLGKVVAMTTGEIDYSGVFHNLDYLMKPDVSEDFISLVFYPISTHIIIIIFIIFMPILISNLLTGLAVYDIEVIQRKAKLYKLNLEAEGILGVQDMFMFTWKGSVARSEVISVLTKPSSFRMLMYKITGYKDTHDQLATFLNGLEKTEDQTVEFNKTTEMKIQDMAEEINNIGKRVIALSENIIDIKSSLDSKY